jgi:hypothetical protein
MGGMPALSGMKFNRRYATGICGMPAIRGLKPTAKINCRYATDRFHLLGMRTDKIPLFDRNLTHWYPKLLAKNKGAGGMPALSGMKFNRRYATGAVGDARAPWVETHG